MISFISFQVQVVTLAELAGCKGRTILNKLKNEINRQSTVPRYRGLPPPVPMNLKTPKIIRRMTDRDEDNLENQLSNDSVMNEKDPDGKRLFSDQFIKIDRSKLRICAYLLEIRRLKNAQIPKIKIKLRNRFKEIFGFILCKNI